MTASAGSSSKTPQSLNPDLHKLLENLGLHANEDSNCFSLSTFFSQLINNSSAGWIITDADQKCVFMNPAAEKITGYTLREIIRLNKSLHEIVHHTKPDGSPYPADECPLYKALSGINKISGEEMFVKPDGSFYPVAFSVIPYADEDKRAGSLIEIRDVSDEKKSQAALQESEERFRTLADNIQIHAWMANPDGSVFWFNKTFYEYTGSVPEMMTGWGWKTTVHPDHLKRATEYIGQALRKSEPWELTFPIRNNSGDYRWFLISAFPLRDRFENVTRWIGTNTDIDKEIQTAEKLESIVEERTKELRLSNENLEQFAHVASHDLKEPVRKIKTFINMLRDEFSDKLPKDGRMYLEKIDSAAKRITIMIEGVLKFSSMGATRLKFERINLTELLRSVESDLELLIAEKKARITYSDLPSFEADALLIYHLFYNLIYNSLKFSREGVNPEISIASEVVMVDQTENVTIRIADNGIGFDQSKAEDIFKPFVRLHSKDKFEGTGLGLAMCRKIAELHGGTITAKGKINEGCEFTVTLPLSH